MTPPSVISFKNNPPIDNDPISATINISARTDDSDDIFNDLLESLCIEIFFVLSAMLLFFVVTKLNKKINKYIFIFYMIYINKNYEIHFASIRNI